MTIDLKWALPVVMPFVLLGLIRLMWWAAGAPWSEPAFAAFLSIAAGMLLGAIIAGFNEHMHWHVTIGKRQCAAPTESPPNVATTRRLPAPETKE